jgi:YggT family protein
MSLWDFIQNVIWFYILVVWIYVILSWLIAFDIVNRRNRGVYMIADSFSRLTEPALRPIRRRLPDFGGVDISPVILLFILYFIMDVVIGNYLKHYLPL